MRVYGHPIKILLADDEDHFREPLAERLEMRGAIVLQAATGREAVRMARADGEIDVVIMDRKMPHMENKQALQDIKTYRPEIQIIMLTGHGSVSSARKAGQLGVFRYLTKPISMDKLVPIIEAAGREKYHAKARLDMPTGKHRHWRDRLIGSQNLRPLVILIGAAILLAAALSPPPAGLVGLLDAPKTGSPQSDPPMNDVISGYPMYRHLAVDQTIAEYYVQRYHPPGPTDQAETATELARHAQLMIGLILTAVLFWATGAVPLGVVALIVAVVMYTGGVMRPDQIAQAFAKDAVVFIFGVLVVSRVISSTGLDRRIARLLMTPVKNLGLLLFVFLPAFSLTCSFISETIMVALMMPMFLAVYQHYQSHTSAMDNRPLLVMFALMLCFSANVGGPGSPAAGGRNAVMIGILSDYDLAPTFVQWMVYGLPFVPVIGLAVGFYFYAMFRTRIRIKPLDAAVVARKSSQELGPMNRDEYTTAAICIMVVLLWIFGNQQLGMGGPILMGLVLLNVFGILKWREISNIHWDLVFLYAGASALGKGLAVTGGALYLAQGFLDALPAELSSGMGLLMAVSLLTGLLTNVMSDGATVAAVGPIAVPMAQSSGLHPWALGFASAFASSFPHMLIIGTPANALVYILCKDPKTGRQLVTQKDFLKHGLAVFILSFVVLWGWAFLGYWRWIGF